MTFPDSMINARRFVVGRAQHTLELLTESERDPDQVDRALAAATLLAGAAVVIWPQGRKAPYVVTATGALARQLWARREWWLPGK